MAETKQAFFEGWAVVEMMGHQREIGFVTTEAYGQAVLFRVDTPELPERDFVLTAPEYMTVEGSYKTVPSGSKVRRAGVPARSRLIAPGSLYAINPCTEEAAVAAIEQLAHRPLALVELAASKALTAATSIRDGLDIDEDFDG